MIYLNSEHLLDIGVNWPSLLDVIRDSIMALNNKKFSQPIKPYLRFGDPKNRIIAMPAFIGGAKPYAGIKWIASFPGNITKGLTRANSVTILNDTETGQPICLFNGALISSIRTASLTGLVISEFLKYKKPKQLAVGIIGFGPIGKMHLEMITALFGSSIGSVRIFDLKEIDIDSINGDKSKIQIVSSWQECFTEADVILTCTVSDFRYIDLIPRKGSILLNVSLRDYLPEIRNHVDVMLVDDWDEICRENTDIENMHNNQSLEKGDTISITQLFAENSFENISDDSVVMFNPMGMGVFDIAVAGHYYNLAKEKSVGISLPD